MSRPLFEAPRALLDVAEILEYLRASSPAAAVRFFDAYDAALELFEKMPLTGGRLLLQECEELELRYGRPRGFESYLIFYRVEPDAIRVVRILHASRDLPSALGNI